MIVNYYGGFGISYGYGSATEQLATSLEAVGVDIRVMRTAGAKGQIIREDMTQAGKELMKKPFAKGDVAICFGHPPFFDVINNYKYRIGVTMFESDKLPDKTERNPDWVAQCNKMTRLWVPSESSKKLFEESGVTIPIDVIRNGIDPNLFPVMQRPKRDVFTFLMYGVLTVRKNPGYALSAFLSLFKDNPKAHLILKTQSGTLGHMNLPEKNVTIIDKKYSHEELLRLIESADAFVFPSRGEGFGLPPLEAMATGLPTIVSANSGMLEFCNEEYNYPVNCPTMVKTTHVPKHWGDIGHWWQPDFQEFKEKMKYLYDNQDLARQKGMAAAEWVRKELTWEVAARKGKSILEEMVQA